jgi:hypothetical protein
MQNKNKNKGIHAVKLIDVGHGIRRYLLPSISI